MKINNYMSLLLIKAPGVKQYSLLVQDNFLRNIEYFKLS